MGSTAMILIDVCILTLSSIGLVTSVTILVLVASYRRRYPINTSILLACNTYPAIVVGSLALIDMYGHNLQGDLYVNVSFDNGWCYLRFYVLLVGFCSIYQSYLLQACFHLFRVVFYKHKQLRSHQFAVRLIALQWISVCLLMLPSLILGEFEYLPDYYHCQIAFSNVRGLAMVAVPIYYVPMLAIAVIYLWIICYTRWKTPVTVRHHRKRSNRRDIVVLRRIITLIALLWTLTFPFVIIWLVYITTGYLYRLSYHLQWLTFAVGLFVLPFASAYFTLPLRKRLRTLWTKCCLLSRPTEIIIDYRCSPRRKRPRIV